MAKSKTKKDTALAKLIAAAPSTALSELILNLAENYPEIRRECFDYLKENTDVSKRLERQSEGEVIMFIWAELLPAIPFLNCGTLPKAWRLCMMTGKPAMPATFTGRSETMINILSFG